MTEGTIKKMFARRQFTPDEREKMKELYTNAELLALRIDRTIPDGVEKELAIHKLKEVLAFCESAVAQHDPKPYYGGVECGTPMMANSEMLKKAEGR